VKLPSRNTRILILLLVLLFVALDAWRTKARTVAWNIPQWLVIYPVNGDGSAASSQFIAQLQEASFAPIKAFFNGEAARYGLSLPNPIEVKLAPQVNEKPPAVPVKGSRLDIILWSLKLRYWSWKHDNYKGPVDLQLFVQFYDPATTQHLGHSTGLEKGRVGIVNAFSGADYGDQNNVIIAHELLHLFGATDKYSFQTNQPVYPLGFAEPDRQPLLPQKLAELMGGRIPVSETKSMIPDSLADVVIGPFTAAEIGWRPN